jgi:NitT/TauT family transport system permease protein
MTHSPGPAPTLETRRPREPFDWNRVLKVGLPLVLFALSLWLWESYVTRNKVPPYILPAPSAIWATLIKDWPVLFASLLTTLKTTLLGLVLAVVGGVTLAVLLSLSRVVEYSLYPYAVVLQVTPVVAISPLLLIYLPQDLAVLACAWIVAFFPVLSHTTLGLQSVDRNLLELFELYGATRPRWAPAFVGRFLSRLKALWYLRRPAALPYFLAGLKIAGGLSLIGAVVAEIAAGSAGAGSGLAYRIVESQYRLNIPRLFAALGLLAMTGVIIFLAMSALSHLLLRRWHESALGQER